MTELGPITITMVPHGVSETVAALTDMQRRLEAMEKGMNAKSIGLAKQKSKEQIALYKKETAEATAQGKLQLVNAKAQAKERTAVAIDEAKTANRAAAAAAREFERHEKAKSKAAERESAKRRALAEREEKAYAKMVGSAASKVAGKVWNVASTAVTLGGGMVLASALRDKMSAEKTAAAISVQSNMPGDRSQFINTKDAMAKIRLGAAASHMDQADYAGGINKIIAATGNTTRAFQVGQQAMTIAKAEGIDPEELGHALGSMMANNPELSNEEVIKNLRLLVGQGKLGMVEMKEMAAVLPRATSTAGKFEGNVAANKAFAAGLLQLGIKTTGDADAAATAVKLLPEDIMKNEAAFKKNGINVRGANGGIRNERDILQDAIVKTGGDPFKLREMFGERSGAITAALSDTYKTAEANQKGSGAKAVSDEFDKLEKATLSTEDIMKDFAITIDTASEQLETMWRDLKDQVGTELLHKLKDLIPEIARLVPKVVELLTAFVDLAAWIADNPIKAALAGLGGMMAIEVGKAMASKAVADAIGGGVGSGLGGPLAIAALGVAIAAAVASAKSAEATKERQTQYQEILNSDATNDEKKAKIAALQSAKKNQAKSSSASGFGDVLLDDLALTPVGGAVALAAWGLGADPHGWAKLANGASNVYNGNGNLEDIPGVGGLAAIIQATLDTNKINSEKFDEMVANLKDINAKTENQKSAPTDANGSFNEAK